MAELNRDVVKQLVDLGRAAADVRTIGNTPLVVIPNDHKVVPLREYVNNSDAERPLRKQGTVKVLDSGSFCEYYSLFSDEHSRVFADETVSKVLAVLDYHGAGENAPRWGAHRVELVLRHSEEWKAWESFDGQRKSQMEFAEFLEDNAPDIVTPDAATMLEVARDLRAKTDVDFGSAVRMSNGSVQFKYTEQVKSTYGAGNVDVPEQFVISIPVYLGCDRVRITARLRHRINSGKLTFWYDLLRSDVVKRDAFLAIRKSIADTLHISVINGSPA